MKLAVAMAALGLAHAKQFTVEEQGKKLKYLHEVAAVDRIA